MGLAIFDICDTLYATNTTVDFLRFFADRNDSALGRRVERWTIHNHAAWWVGAASHRLLRYDLAKTRMLAGLAGHDRGLIESEASAFEAERLPALANRPLMDRLERHRTSGDEVWLVSSTIAPVAEAIGRSLGVPAYGSELGYANGRCTGRLLVDLAGRKADWLLRRADSMQRPLSVYTDNRSDLALIELADQATVVLPKGQKQHWAGNGYDYVEL